MSDEVLTIKITERELDLIHQCISTSMETVKRRHDVTGSTADLLQELGELSDDLLEQLHRRDDPDWEPTEIGDGFSFSVTENDFIQQGINARETQKQSSRAATRRNFNLKVKDKRLSKTQTHDVWDANDPRNW